MTRLLAVGKIAPGSRVQIDADLGVKSRTDQEQTIQLDAYTLGNLDGNDKLPVRPEQYGLEGERAEAYRRGHNSARR